MTFCLHHYLQKLLKCSYFYVCARFQTLNLAVIEQRARAREKRELEQKKLQPLRIESKRKQQRRECGEKESKPKMNKRG